jgi:hypothetical protein
MYRDDKLSTNDRSLQTIPPSTPIVCKCYYLVANVSVYTLIEILISRDEPMIFFLSVIFVYARWHFIKLITLKFNRRKERK